MVKGKEKWDIFNFGNIKNNCQLSNLIKKIQKDEKIFDNEYIFLIVTTDKECGQKGYFKKSLQKGIQKKIEKVKKSVQDDKYIADFSVYFFFISDENKEKLTKIIKKVLKEFGKRAKLLTFRYNYFFEKVLSADEIKYFEEDNFLGIKELEHNDEEMMLEKFENEITNVIWIDSFKKKEEKKRNSSVWKRLTSWLDSSDSSADESQNSPSCSNELSTPLDESTKETALYPKIIKFASPLINIIEKKNTNKKIRPESPNIKEIDETETDKTNKNKSTKKEVFFNLESTSEKKEFIGENLIPLVQKEKQPLNIYQAKYDTNAFNKNEMSVGLNNNFYFLSCDDALQLLQWFQWWKKEGFFFYYNALKKISLLEKNNYSFFDNNSSNFFLQRNNNEEKPEIISRIKIIKKGIHLQIVSQNFFIYDDVDRLIKKIINWTFNPSSVFMIQEKEEKKNTLEQEIIKVKQENENLNKKNENLEKDNKNLSNILNELNEKNESLIKKKKEYICIFFLLLLLLLVCYCIRLIIKNKKTIKKNVV